MDETGDEKVVLVVYVVAKIVVDVAGVVLAAAEDVGADAAGIGVAQEPVVEEVEEDRQNVDEADDLDTEIHMDRGMVVALTVLSQVRLD